MNDLPKQSVGIDMSSRKFDVCFSRTNANGEATIKGTRKFSNDAKGFKSFLQWVKAREVDLPLIYVVEATGVYHENLCYFLYQNNENISVQLAQKVKYFIKSLNLKTKTDKVDATAIALMGLSRKLKLWEPLTDGFRTIRDLTRTLVKLKRQASVTKSQIHAIESAHNTDKESIRIMKQLLDKQKQLMAKCEKKILELVEKDGELNQRVQNITAIPGIGVITVIKLLAETDGFRNSSSIRSLVSYAGLDVVQQQSGMRKGRSRISKRGNKYIRNALFMPSMSAVRHDQKSKRTYERLNERLPKKRQSQVAVMRKLLIVIYTLWKNNEQYDPSHEWTKKRRDLSLVAG